MFAARSSATAVALAFALAAAARAADVGPLDRNIVVRESHATFTVKHLYLLDVTGTVPIRSGTATFADAAAAVPTAIEATLDPRHLDTHDGDRDDDLQGPDWFDTKVFPTWTFRSTSIVATSGGFSANGTLTIHGVAAPITLEVAQIRPFPHPAYHAVGHVDRHAFGMKITPVDGLIGTDITIALDVVLQ